MHIKKVIHEYLFFLPKKDNIPIFQVIFFKVHFVIFQIYIKLHIFVYI